MPAALTLRWPLLQVVSSKYKTAEVSTNNVPFEAFLKFSLRTPASKRNTWQKGIVAAHKKLLQAVNVLEAPEPGPIRAMVDAHSSTQGQPICLVHPDMIPTYQLLIQASHNCGHAPLLQSICWKDHRANFQISRCLMKLQCRASPPALWEALAPCIGLHEILFMAVYIREGLLAERSRLSAAIGPKQMQQMDETLAGYNYFAENMRKLSCHLLFTSISQSKVFWHIPASWPRCVAGAVKHVLLNVEQIPRIQEELDKNPVLDLGHVQEMIW